MTLSLGQLGDGFEKSMRQATDSLESRLQGTTSTHRHGMSWEYHRGIPRADKLPNADVATFLMPVGIVDDKDAPFRANYFQVRWRLSIVVKDPGTDPYGYDFMRATQAAGAVVSALTETNAAISLDAAVDFTEWDNASFAVADVAGGDALVGEWLIMFTARHPLVYRE